MTTTRSCIGIVGGAGLALLALAGAAQADGYEGSVKDAPVDEGRQFTWSITIGGTSDYVFRGVSQTDEKPAFQASVDVAYGILYAGIWGSNTDEAFVGGSPAEIDIYGGIKPVLGPVTFDLGVIYYGYPGQDDAVSGGLDVDYWEFKAGASISPVTNLALGGAFYFSPEYTFETGDVWTVEGTAAYTLPTLGIFTPTISGLVGYQSGEDAIFLATNGFDEYVYWNAGLALGVEKFTFDLRYWDTDISENVAVGGLADERFVFTAKVTLP